MIIGIWLTATSTSAVAGNTADLVTSPASERALEVEIDPIAYLASGYSLHLALASTRYRLDLGAFAAELPEGIHGNQGFDVSFHGFGSKLDVFWHRNRTGAFAGIELGLINALVVDRESRRIDADRRVQGGVRAGWRFEIAEGYYLVPWIGVGYAAGASERSIAGRAYQESALVVFPTVHIGKSFR